MSLLRCKKCSHVIIENSNNLIDIHSNPMDITASPNSNCVSNTLSEDTLWYLKHEDISWIKSTLDQKGWTKGKVNCPKCSQRIGSYDFISGNHCSCGSYIVPSVHLVKSKLDLIKL